MHAVRLPDVRRPCAGVPRYAAARVPTTKPPSPKDPGFRTLPVAPSGENAGTFMNREAVRRLTLAHDSGWSYDELVTLYDDLRLQIQAASPGWTADRASCRDGSTAFVGGLGAVLAILPNRSLYIGHLGSAEEEGLLSYSGMTFTHTGSVQFPPPNPRALGTKRIR